MNILITNAFSAVGSAFQAQRLFVSSFSCFSTQSNFDTLLFSHFRYELFLSSSDLHVFRAVEPALRRRWTMRDCPANRGPDFAARCERSNAEG